MEDARGGWTADPRAIPPGRRRPLLRALARRAAGGSPPRPAALESALLSGLPDEQRAALPALAEAAGLGVAATESWAPRLPSAEAARLHDLRDRTLARGARLRRERSALAVALRAAGADYRPLKGAWVAPRAWRPAAARPMADTDLWLPDAARPAGERALLALGYRPAGRTWKHAVWRRPGERVVDPRGEHPDNPRPVELHSRLGESFRGVDLYWDGWPARGVATSSGAGGAGGPMAQGDKAEAPGFDPVLLPSAEDAEAQAQAEDLLLAQLLAHASVDALSRRLRPTALVDVALLATALDDEVWERCARRMARPRAARFAWPALALAERELGFRAPRRISARCAAFVRPELRAWARSQDLDAVSRLGAAPRALLEIPRIWPMDAVERRAFWRHALWPPPDRLADRYPALLASRGWPLAYALHVRDTLGTARRRWRRRG